MVPEIYPEYSDDPAPEIGRSADGKQPNEDKGSATRIPTSNSTNGAFSGRCELRQVARLKRVASVAQGPKPYLSQHRAFYAGLVLFPADASSFLAPEGAILRS